MDSRTKEMRQEIVKLRTQRNRIKDDIKGRMHEMIEVGEQIERKSSLLRKMVKLERSRKIS